MSMKHSKASYIMQEGIAYQERKDTSEICKNKKFSLIIDENTDIGLSVAQILAVMVRFLDETNTRL